MRMDSEEEIEQIGQNAAAAFERVVNMFEDFQNDNLLFKDLLNDTVSILEKYKDTSVGSYSTPLSPMDNIQEPPLNAKPSPSSVPIFLRIVEFIKNHQVKSLPSHTSNIEKGEQFAEEQALSIDVILDNILDHLPASDLKTCRAVSFKWNLNATKIILKKQLFLISLHVVDSTTHLVQRIRKNSTNKSTFDLRELVKLILDPKIDESRISSAGQTKSSWLFPSSHFAFWSNNVSNKTVQMFTEKCGHIIQNFELQVDDRKKEDEEEFRRLLDLKTMLTNHLPNLETLTLGTFPLAWYEPDDLGQLFPEPRSMSLAGIDNGSHLRKLKTLNFKTKPPAKILMDLEESVPSFSRTTLNGYCDPEILHELAERNKNLVTDIRLAIHPANLHACEFFLKTHGNKLRLKVLSIRLVNSSNFYYSYWNRGFRVISEFLRCSCQSLVELHTDRFGSWPDFEIPVLPKLKLLRVTGITEGNKNFSHSLNKLFPSNAKLSTIFPALETFHMAFQKDTDWKVKIGATTQNKLPWVRRLFLSCVPAVLVTQFCNMFPNVKFAYVDTLGGFRAVASALWTLKKLEDLTTSLEVIRDGNNMHPALGVRFKGFSDETCLQLYASSKDVDISTVDSRRENVSLMNLKSRLSLEAGSYIKFYELRRSNIHFFDFGAEYAGSIDEFVSTNIARYRNILF